MYYKTTNEIMRQLAGWGNLREELSRLAILHFGEKDGSKNDKVRKPGDKTYVPVPADGMANQLLHRSIGAIPAYDTWNAGRVFGRAVLLDLTYRYIVTRELDTKSLEAYLACDQLYYGNQVEAIRKGRLLPAP